MNGKINNICQIAYLRRYTFTSGVESGIKVIEINTGKIRILLNESKTLDVMQVFSGNDNMSFVSKNGFTAREIPFLNRFEGGMLYTCGLDVVGGEPSTLHGTLHNIPATVLQAEIINDDIIVRAEMNFSALFGDHLRLTRTVTTKIGSDSFNVHDNLENLGYFDSEYCLLYHMNVGYPMLDEGTEININIDSIITRTDWAKQRLGDRAVFSAPVDNEPERCYFINTTDGNTSVVNRKLGKKLEFSYSKDTLPYFIQWCSGGSGDYALGLEPSTTFLDDHFKKSVIKKGEKIDFNLSFRITEI